MGSDANLLEEMKSDSDLSRIPVIVLTTSTAEADIHRCYESHANCYIAKPVDIDLLLALLRVWIGRAEAGADAPPMAGVSTAA